MRPPSAQTATSGSSRSGTPASRPRPGARRLPPLATKQASAETHRRSNTSRSTASSSASCWSGASGPRLLAPDSSLGYQRRGTRSLSGTERWAVQDSNLRPPACKAGLRSVRSPAGSRMAERNSAPSLLPSRPVGLPRFPVVFGGFGHTCATCAQSVSQAPARKGEFEEDPTHFPARGGVAVPSTPGRRRAGPAAVAVAPQRPLTARRERPFCPWTPT